VLGVPSSVEHPHNGNAAKLALTKKIVNVRTSERIRPRLASRREARFLSRANRRVAASGHSFGRMPAKCWFL